MTEPTPTPPPAPAADPAPTPDTGTDWKAEAEKWKALSRKHEDQAKASQSGQSDMEKRLAELEPLRGLASALGVKPDKGKTDVETLTEQISAMQKQQADAELRAMRLEVAAEKGLTPAQAARLSGSTRDELATDADALKALFPGASGTPGTPQPDPSQGSRGNAGELEAQLAKAVADKNVGEQVRIKTALAASKTQ